MFREQLLLGFLLGYLNNGSLWTFDHSDFYMENYDTLYNCNLTYIMPSKRLKIHIIINLSLIKSSKSTLRELIITKIHHTDASERHRKKQGRGGHCCLSSMYRTAYQVKGKKNLHIHFFSVMNRYSLWVEACKCLIGSIFRLVH